MNKTLLKGSVVVVALMGLVGCSDDNAKKPAPANGPEVDQVTQVRKAVEEEGTKAQAEQPLLTDPTHLVEPAKPQEESGAPQTTEPQGNPTPAEPKPETAAAVKEETPAKEPAPAVDSTAPKAEKQEKKEAKRPAKAQPTVSAASDESQEELVRRLIEELKVLPLGEPCVQWIKAHAATRIIADKLLEGKKLPEADMKHFRSTISEFIAANVKTFLPLIKDYTVEKVALARETKNLKNFALVMRENSTKEVINVEALIVSKGTRIMNIIVQETSLQSILQTSFSDILQSKTPREAWDRFLKGEKLS